MPQVFARAADMWLRVGLAAVCVAVVVFFLLGAGYVRSSYATRLGWVVEQPVPFSHEHHVSGLGIDCRYCHSSVEVSSEAGYPPTHTCMTCHSQVWTGAPVLALVRQSLAAGTPIHWRRVADVPGYVYFRHDIHVHAGVACVVCHGHVERMPLTFRTEPFEMQWCVDCHRDPGPRLRPREHVTDMRWSTNADRRALGLRLMREYGIDPRHLTDCSTCHR